MNDDQVQESAVITEVRDLLESIEWFPEPVVLPEPTVESDEWLENLPYELYVELFGE